MPFVGWGTEFGDFDGDGRQELVFWNQGGNRLVLARVPARPRDAGEWPTVEIYAYGSDSEMEQRAMEGLLLLPTPARALYYGKAIANWSA